MANGKRTDDGGLDVLALLKEVHGDAADAEGAAVEVALRTLERTHRRASLAMRQFERGGRTATLGATQSDALLVDVAQGPPEHLQNEQTAAVQPSALAEKQRRSQEETVLWRPTPTSPQQAALSGAVAQPSAAPPAPVTLAPAQVYAGEGAQITPREATKTKVMPRQKK